MTRQETFERTVEIMRECVPELQNTVMEEDITVDAELGVDSMSFILVLCRIEQEFSVRIPKRQWYQIRTLGEVVDAVERYRA